MSINPKNLRRRIIGNQNAWTLEEISLGFEYFKELHGSYPTSNEINKFEFLPTARTIERSHGGLIKIRTLLGFEENCINYTKGAIRSEKCKQMYANGSKYEDEFYQYLLSFIPEVRIHEQKFLRPGKIRCDFFVYLDDARGVAIDVFYAKDLYTLQGIITIKTKRYKSLTIKTYFVLMGNKNISQEEINLIVNNKRNALPVHISVMTENTFKELLQSLV